MGLRGAENHVSNLLCDPDREEEAAGPELTPPSQLSPGGAGAGATNKGPRGRRLWSMMGLRCLDGPETGIDEKYNWSPEHETAR